MAKQMWFGNERHFQWVPAPATGISVNNVGYFERIDYQDGRTGIFGVHQTHKEFEMEFPVQEAGGLQGLDVFQKYASGFYGNQNDYPFFFADPMHYDQNLFSQGWASPGLFGGGWASIGESESRSYYNFVLNPSAELATTDYSFSAGTSGTASGALNTNLPASGTKSYRVTWSVGTSAVSGDIRHSSIPVTVGQTYDLSCSITCNKTQRLQMKLFFKDGGGGIISTPGAPEAVILGNTTTRFEVLSQTAPANAVTVEIRVETVSGTSASNWTTNDWLQMDAVMMNYTSNRPDAYFDGDTVGAFWTGVEHASASAMHIYRNVPTISATSANSFNLPPNQATFTVRTVSGAYPTFDNQFGNIPYALIPIPPTHVLWLGASGSATGTAVLKVDLFNAPGNPASPAATSNLTLLSSTGSTRLNASFSGASYQYAKVYITRTSSAASTITLSALMAQLWPIGVTPVTTGNFVEGKGHRGLKFADAATTESYVMVDPNRNVPVHYKGLSTSLVESQDKG